MSESRRETMDYYALWVVGVDFLFLFIFFFFLFGNEFKTFMVCQDYVFFGTAEVTQRNRNNIPIH